MRNGDRTYLFLLAALFGAVVLVEALTPRPLDWTESYMGSDTRPFGGRILREQLPALFPGATVQSVDLAPFLWLRDTTRVSTTYLFVTDRFAPDPAEAEALLAFVARGNRLFVAAEAFEGALADTLGVETAAYLGAVLPGMGKAGDSLSLHFLHAPPANGKPLRYRSGLVRSYFAHPDTQQVDVLGWDEQEGVNFVSRPWGRGRIYLSTLPLLFTNYALLNADEGAYATTALSHLPVDAVAWDAYYKLPLRQAGTPLRFILSTPSLRRAYGLLLVSLVLFIVFEGRRRQRVIPVLEPARNTTLEFVQTVGRLYFHHGDHANLARKKITYFLDHLRNHLQIATPHLDEAFITNVTARSGASVETVGRLIRRVEAVKDLDRLSEKELLALNADIEAYHQERKR